MNNKLFFVFIVLGLAFLLIMISAIVLPIYTDEIAWSIIKDRLIYDGFRLTQLLPQCEKNFSLEVPLTWWPYRFLTSLFTSILLQNPFLIHSFSVLKVSFWYFLIWKLVNKNLNILILVMALLTMGVLPFLLSLSRPENNIISWLLIILVIKSCFQVRTNRPSAFVQITFLSCSACFFSEHPITIIFVPFIIFSWYQLNLKQFKSKIFYAGLLLILIMVFDVYSYNSARASCPEINYDLKTRIFLSPDLLLVSPKEFFSKLFSNFFAFPKYFDGLEFQDAYLSNWLPSRELGSGIYQFVNIILVLIFSIMFFQNLINFASSIFSGFYKNAKLFNFDHFTLSLALILMILIQTDKPAYSGALFFILLVLIFVLPNSSSLQFLDIECLFRSKILFGIVVISLVSQSLLLQLFKSDLLEGWQKGGYIKDQLHSVSPFRFSESKSNIYRIAERCNIDLERKLNHFIVDDLSYIVLFDKLYRPFHIVFLSSKYTEGYFEPQKLLAKYKSAGGIFNCDLLPLSLQKFAEKDGSFCCIRGF